MMTSMMMWNARVCTPLPDLAIAIETELVNIRKLGASLTQVASMYAYALEVSQKSSSSLLDELRITRERIEQGMIRL